MATRKPAARTEDAPLYLVDQPRDTLADDATITAALAILTMRLREPGAAMNSPNACKDFLRLRLAGLPHEVFCVLFLDAQHRVIEFREMFRGSLTQTAVYPREIVKATLETNAAAVILSHNHPSGQCDPSRADEMLTKTLHSSLALIDVRVLDHIIVGGAETCSFAERGLV